LRAAIVECTESVQVEQARIAPRDDPGWIVAVPRLRTTNLAWPVDCQIRGRSFEISVRGVLA
jgi:hypothetical protein